MWAPGPPACPPCSASTPAWRRRSCSSRPRRCGDILHYTLCYHYDYDYHYQYHYHYHHCPNHCQVYRIVSVLQPPFMQFNSTTRELEILKDFPWSKTVSVWWKVLIWYLSVCHLSCWNINTVASEQLNDYLMIPEKHEGYCNDLIAEIAKILG